MRVLVVDDDRQCREMYAQFLRFKGLVENESVAEL